MMTMSHIRPQAYKDLAKNLDQKPEDFPKVEFPADFAGYAHLNLPGDLPYFSYGP
jgi:hypothetical protein